MPKGFVIHRKCPRTDPKILQIIGKSRDKSAVHLARQETIDAYERMRDAAAKEGVQLHIIWAFRDPALQQQQFEEAKLKHGPRNGIKWLAPPGFSEHQTGWVLDIGDLDDPLADDNPLFERTHAFQWLKDHAVKISI